MTVLSVCQTVAVRLNQSRPSALFSATDDFHVELRLIANEAADALMRRYDWRVLCTEATLTGDDTTTEFDLPSDFNRVVRDAKVFSTRSKTPMSWVRDVNQWLDIQISDVFAAPGYCILLGGHMHIEPVLVTGENAKFYYVSNQIVSDGEASPTYKALFTADDDTLRVPEILLEKEIVWRWRASKRMPYSEEMREAEIALADAVARDRGAQTLVVGRRRLPRDVQMAYPGVIVP